MLRSRVTSRGGGGVVESGNLPMLSGNEGRWFTLTRFLYFVHPVATAIVGVGKTTYTFSANANVFPFRFRLTHPPRLLVTR